MERTQPEAVIAAGLAKLNIEGKRVPAIVPDTTRTAPVGPIMKIIHRHLDPVPRRGRVLWGKKDGA